MATVEALSVRRTILPYSPRTARTKKAAMTITPEAGGTSLRIPYAPQAVSHSNLVAEYVTIDRPGLLESVVFSNLMRPRMSMDLDIHDKKVTATSGGAQTLQRAISVIQAIQNMARKGKRVRIAYGALESGLWYILDMKVKSERRDPINDEIISATVSLDLVRGDTSISGTGTGPVTGGAVTVTKPQPAKTTSPTQAAIDAARNLVKTPITPAARFYVTRSGDTLWKISLKFYGTGTRWQRIADANGIKDPRKMPVGKKLRIP
jgi:LysM repeat protein